MGGIGAGGSVGRLLRRVESNSSVTEGTKTGGRLTINSICRARQELEGGRGGVLSEEKASAGLLEENADCAPFKMATTPRGNRDVCERGENNDHLQ